MAKGLEMMMMKRWLNKKEGWGWRWAQQSMKDMDIDEGLMVLCKTVLQLGIRIWVRMAKGLEMMMMKRWLNKKEGWGWRWAQQSMKDMDIDEGLMVLCKTVLQLGIRIWVRMAKGLEMMMMKRWLNKKEGWGWRWAQQSMKDIDIDGGLWQHKERYIGHH